MHMYRQIDILIEGQIDGYLDRQTHIERKIDGWMDTAGYTERIALKASVQVLVLVSMTVCSPWMPEARGQGRPRAYTPRGLSSEGI